MAKKDKRTLKGAPEAKSLADTVSRLINEMEEPLREAAHTVHVLSILAVKESDDLESIAFIATKAKVQLATVGDGLRALFTAISREC